MFFRSLIRPWGYDEKQDYPIKKALILNLLCSVVVVYFVSVYVIELFRADIRNLFSDMFSLSHFPLITDNAFSGQVISFLLLYGIVYIILYLLFCKRRNPYFKQVALIWIVYGVLCLKDTWFSLLFRGEWITPEAIGGFQIATLVLFIPLLVAVILDYYYTTDTRALLDQKRVLSAVERLRRKVGTILAILGIFNLLFATFHRVHMAVYNLWLISLVTLVLFLMFLVIDNVLSRGETFHVLLNGRRINDRIF